MYRSLPGKNSLGKMSAAAVRVEEEVVSLDRGADDGRHHHHRPPPLRPPEHVFRHVRVDRRHRPLLDCSGRVSQVTWVGPRLSSVRRQRAATPTTRFVEVGLWSRFSVTRVVV